jgi:pectin methylesterase-like acyl-CoA thioesterase
MDHTASKPAAMAMLALLLLGLSPAVTAAPVRPGPPSLVVPNDFPTIQSAVDAAKPGATVTVLAGTYTEQVTITKKLSLVGAGMDATVIRAPATLVPGPLGSTAGRTCRFRA